MIKLKINEQTYKIVFKHVRTDLQSKSQRKKHRPRTIAIIQSLEDNNVLAEGVTKLSPLDNFCKEEGRKRSLEKAIEGLDSSLQEKILYAYENRKKIELVC